MHAWDGKTGKEDGKMTWRKSFLQVCGAWLAGAILLAGLSGCDGSREAKSEVRERRSILDKIQQGGVVKASIGHVEIGRRVYLAPFSSVRGAEGQPIHIGNESNVQDGVVIHALETVAYGKPVWKNTYAVYGQRYAVYIGDRVSLAHQSHVHGPAYIEDDVFVGMQAMVFMSHVGRGTVIEPGRSPWCVLPYTEPLREPRGRCLAKAPSFISWAMGWSEPLSVVATCRGVAGVKRAYTVRGGWGPWGAIRGGTEEAAPDGPGAASGAEGKGS